MIPALPTPEKLPPLYAQYLRSLQDSGFRGEIQSDYGSRLITATDNSVYQFMPVAVVFPRDEQDICRVLRLAHDPRFHKLKLSPRGGGTGTNGQSLSDGIIIDVSRHQNTILEVNLEQGFARVQPGVVLDQLNDHLRPHGVFFAPNLSPSSRATIGGMVNTDACGKGSRIYGKTSDHVLRLRAVLLDGTAIESGPLSPEQLQTRKQEPGLVGEVHRVVDEIVTTHKQTIATALPKLKRFLTGYDLAHVYTDAGQFNLNSVIAGSEGTLALLTEATVKLTPLPKKRLLLAIRYSEFDAALRAATVLVQSDPGAIETVDDNIVSLARKDTIWSSVAHLIEPQPSDSNEATDEAPTAAINLVEFESDDPAVVLDKVASLSAQLDFERGQPGKCTGYSVASEAKDIAALWTLRKKGVGLLGNTPGERRPVPFVEDTAVPPEHLADYIQGFRKILDRHGLRYGMFGHVDVGCLHVRPALNLRDPMDEKLLRTISDEVVALVKSFGGVLWAEHGKGFRSEYSPTFFGPELYEQLRKVKGAFDPHNQLNPGKLATPLGSNDKLVSIDALKRGAFDRQIQAGAREQFAASVNCNGNGACFDYQPDHVMCPSSKVTRNRIHSPKGRAGMLREWLRQLSEAGHDVSQPHKLQAGSFNRSSSPDDFSHEVYDAMNGCLACKACATQCPIKVDIPAMRADFYEQYHSRYRRPLKDYFVASLEGATRLMALLPRLFNFFLRRRWVQSAVASIVGIVDAPMLSEQTLAQGLKQRKAPKFQPAKLALLSPEEKSRTVLIAQDMFTSFYESNVALATYDVLTKLGLRVVFLPFFENGKGLHIKGFLKRFRKLVRQTLVRLEKVQALDIPIVGIEPAVTLTYRDEFAQVLGKETSPVTIQLLQEYLCEAIPRLTLPPKPAAETFTLFGHCTERTDAPSSQSQWKQVFEALGQELATTTTGCCGMCGVFGHEASHRAESKGVFKMSWAKQLPAEVVARKRTLASGHSCRSQVKRFGGFVPLHPMEALAEAYSSTRRQ